MTDPRVMPDPAVVLDRYLDTHEHIDQAGAAGRVGTATPRTTDDPWVRVTLIDPAPDPTSPALHLLACFFQFDCYGGDDKNTSEAQASLLGRSVQAAVHEIHTHSFDDVVVNSSIVGGPRPIPDDDLKPARHRYILEATIHMHPAP